MYRDYFQLEYTDVIEMLENGIIENNFSLTQYGATVPCSVSGITYTTLSQVAPGITVGLFNNEGKLVARELSLTNGKFEINNIEPGLYTLYAVQNKHDISTPKYIELTSGNLDVGRIITYSSYYTQCIYGILLDEQGLPLANKKIKIKGNDDETSIINQEVFTAEDGEFLATLYLTSNASITFEVTLVDRYYALAAPISQVVNSGDLVELNLTGIKLFEPPKGIVTGIITNKQTGDPLINARLGLYKVDETGKETLIKLTSGATDGRYIFDEVDEGNYIIKAKTVKSYTS